MTEENNPILSQVEPSRRGFVKTVLAGAAFAAPVIASFSIDSLGVDAAYGQSASSSVASYSGGYGPCLPDVGYVGPAQFQAFVLDVSGSTRVNGELTISVRMRDNMADVRLQMTKDADVSSAYLTLNGINAANIVLRPDNDWGRRHYEGTIGANDLVGVCDFNSLLQGLASQTGAAVVLGTYSSASFRAQGSVLPGAGPSLQPRE